MHTELELTTAPEVPIEAECLSPAKIKGLSQSGIEHLAMMHGNRKVRVGDFFSRDRERSELIAPGRGPVAGQIHRCRNEGGRGSREWFCRHAPRSWHVRRRDSCFRGRFGLGRAGDERGTDRGDGQCGAHGGQRLPGPTRRDHGGEILIHGNVKNELGSAMRRGLIAVGGQAGDFVGVNMRAGTIVVMGGMGIRAGAGRCAARYLVRTVELLPTFTYSCWLRPTSSGLPVPPGAEWL